MSRMNNEEGLGITDEGIIAKLHKKIGLYQIGMASEIDKRERVIVEAEEREKVDNRQPWSNVCGR